MANRDTSKQRRAKENRAKRAALAARTSGEPPKRPSRVAPSTAEKLANNPRSADAADPSKDSDARGSKGSSAKGGGGRSDKGAKPKRERPKRLGDTPVDIDTLEGSWFSKVIKVPGGTQILMAVVLTVMVTGMLATMDAFVAPGDIDKKDAKATLTIFEAYSTSQAVFSLAVPLLLVFTAAGFVLHRQRRRIWVGCAMLLAVLFGTTMPHYIFPVGFLAYAVMRSSKVEGPNESMFAAWRRRRAGADPESDEVAVTRESVDTSDATGTTDTTQWIE